VVDDAIAQARATPSMSGLDLAKVVSVREPYEWKETTWALGRGHGALKEPRFHVVAYDFGVKFNILRMLAARGCRITVVPAQTSAADVLARNPTASSSPTDRAIPSRATTPSRRRASSSSAACRRSASASATRSWRSPPARAPTR
jgi:hypothetical protein